MNTADRSLAMLDYALRRRFAFFELAPAFDNESFKAVLEKQGTPAIEKLVAVIGKLNSEITSDESLGRGFAIGHSCLFGHDGKLVNDGHLADVVEFELVPLIEEYWFDNPEQIRTTPQSSDTRRQDSIPQTSIRSSRTPRTRRPPGIRPFRPYPGCFSTQAPTRRSSPTSPAA